LQVIFIPGTLVQNSRGR